MPERIAPAVVRVGTTIRYRRKHETRTGTIMAIDRCHRRGDKFGEPAAQVSWAERENAYLTLDTGYCYGYELL